MKRRHFLPLSGVALLWQPGAAAETLAVHYRKDPPYEALRPAIAPPSGDPMASPPAKPTTANTRFRNITADVLSSDQLSKGVPYWLARLDPATGIDLYGNHGIAPADIDHDGRDELYVCQPAGLPNRLFRWTAAIASRTSAPPPGSICSTTRRRRCSSICATPAARMPSC